MNSSKVGLGCRLAYLVGGTPPKPPRNFKEAMTEAKKKPVRTFRKTIRFTEDEAKRLEAIARAKGIPVAELIRKKVLDLPVPDRISPKKLAKRLEEFRKLLYEVNKIGVNLNQIARHCNKYREVDCEVLVQLIEIKRELKALVQTAYEELTGDNRQASREKLPQKES